MKRKRPQSDIPNNVCCIIGEELSGRRHTGEGIYDEMTEQASRRRHPGEDIFEETSEETSEERHLEWPSRRTLGTSDHVGSFGVVRTEDIYLGSPRSICTKSEAWNHLE